MRDVMTPEDVADYLDLAPQIVYALVRNRDLPASGDEGKYRIQRQDLETFLLTHPDRTIIREGLFRRVLEIAERNPDVDGDELLEELEREDAARRARIQPR